jgi:ADP-ribose pyrophosphatase YjhB (NUDIX family)
MSVAVRDAIRKEVASIEPLDDLERRTRDDVLDWIDSGAELCRLEKPATPDKHLVSYFAVVDGDHILLVDHINAELWLPTGGHVEPEEHPRDTAMREAAEELNLQTDFSLDGPLLVTSTLTVGKTAGHTDVSIWYALSGDRREKLVFDESEFLDARWFHRTEIPFDRADPELRRFVAKLYGEVMLVEPSE